MSDLRQLYGGEYSVIQFAAALAVLTTFTIIHNISISSFFVVLLASNKIHPNFVRLVNI